MNVKRHRPKFVVAVNIFFKIMWPTHFVANAFLGRRILRPTHFVADYLSWSIYFVADVFLGRLFVMVDIFCGRRISWPIICHGRYILWPTHFLADYLSWSIYFVADVFHIRLILWIISLACHEQNNLERQSLKYYKIYTMTNYPPPNEWPKLSIDGFVYDPIILTNLFDTITAGLPGSEWMFPLHKDCEWDDETCHQKHDKGNLWTLIFFAPQEHGLHTMPIFKQLYEHLKDSFGVTHQDYPKFITAARVFARWGFSGLMSYYYVKCKDYMSNSMEDRHIVSIASDAFKLRANPLIFYTQSRFISGFADDLVGSKPP